MTNLDKVLKRVDSLQVQRRITVGTRVHSSSDELAELAPKLAEALRRAATALGGHQKIEGYFDPECGDIPPWCSECYGTDKEGGWPCADFKALSEIESILAED